MNRQELATKVQNLVNQAYLHDIDNKYYKGLMHEAEKLREPATLADVLGWEVGVLYEDNSGYIYRLKEPNELQEYHNEIESWTYVDLGWSSNTIDRLRNAEKVEDKKYYAKVKGWGLIDNSRFLYWNYHKKGDVVFIISSENADTYKSALTKAEWEELGINDTNADFEEVDLEC